jgi:hypothetical protein
MNTQKRKIDVLKYIGKKSVFEFTILPFPVDHLERIITLTDGQVMRSGIDISPEAFRYLKRDYRALVSTYTEDLDNAEMFKLKLSKLVDEYDLSKEKALKIFNTVYSKKSRIKKIGSTVKKG